MEKSAPGRTLTEPEFSEAVAKGLPQLIAIARRLSGDEEIASESVQNALLKASKSWRRFRGQSHVQTWLTKIVIHAVRDAIAAHRRHEAKMQMLPQYESEQRGHDAVDPNSGPSQQVQEAEFRSAITAAVRQLPDRQREVFGLIIWQGMNAHDVGRLLDLSPQTVHANLHAARKRVRELLSHFLHEDQDQ